MNDKEHTIEYLTTEGIRLRQFAPDIAEVLCNLPEACSRRLIQAFQDLYNRKLILEWQAQPLNIRLDRDSHDYLKGFYDGCKHHSKG